MQRLPYFIIASFVVGLDRLLKSWADHSLILAQPRPLIGQAIRLTRVHNVGGAFGLSFGNGILFLAVSSAVAIGLIVVISAFPPRGTILKAGLSLVLGGAIGNLIDRLTFGYVLDFFEIRGFPVFNLADACITVGVGVILIHMLFGGGHHRSQG
jgi:signal peptidase II